MAKQPVMILNLQHFTINIWFVFQQNDLNSKHLYLYIAMLVGEEERVLADSNSASSVQTNILRSFTSAGSTDDASNWVSV